MQLEAFVRLLGALWAALLLLRVLPAGAASADFLLLREDWAPNTVDDPACSNIDNSCASKLDYGAFTIRDMVLSNASMEELADCSGPEFDASQIPADVQSELQCVLSQDQGVWQSVWNSGGRCSGLDISQYFTLLAASYNLLNANGPLSAASPTISAPFVDRDELLDTLKAAWGVQPWAVCNPGTKSLLYVTICLDPSAAQSAVVLPVDCPGDRYSDVPGGAECAGPLTLPQGPAPPDSCTSYYPASLEQAYLPPPDLGQPSGGGSGAAAISTGAQAAAVADNNNNNNTTPPAASQGAVALQPNPTAPVGASPPAAFAFAPSETTQPSAEATRFPQPPQSEKPAAGGGQVASAAAPSKEPWTGPLPQEAQLNNGTATVSNGADFLQAMADGLGDIAVAADISFSPGDFHFQSYTLPINVSGAMRVRAADPATPVVIDWSNVSGLINVYEGSALILQDIVSQNVGDGREAIADRTVRVQVVGSPLWPTVTGSSGHQVLFLGSYLVVREPNLFQQAPYVLSNLSEPASNGEGMFYGNLTVVTPSLVLVDLTQLRGLGVAASSYTAGKALYSLINTTTDTVGPAPPPAPPVPPEQPTSSSSGLSAGAAAGIAVGIVLVSAAALAALLVWRRRSRAAKLADPLKLKGGSADSLPHSSTQHAALSPSGDSSPKSGSFDDKEPPAACGAAVLAEVVVSGSGGTDGGGRGEAASERALTASAGSRSSGGSRPLKQGPPLARQVSQGGSSDAPGTAHSVLPGTKNPFLSNTTRDQGGAEGAAADDLFLSYIRTRLLDAPGASPASGAGSEPPRSVTPSRESSLTPGVRRAALSSSDSSLWDIPFEQLHLEGKIGEGAFGRVYRGEWHATAVAVKLLLAQAQLQDGGSIAEACAKPSPVLMRLQEEADLMFSLRHPNCVQLMGTCLAPPCLVTEYCARGSLADVLREARRDPGVAAALTWHRRIQMALDAAKGMLYLHSYQPPIVHRDMKSPNLLVDKDWNVKVADFNLSKILGEEGSSSQEVTNPRWLAPEVLQGDQATPPSDVYGYGVVLWELLTFQIPWSQIAVPVNPWQLARMVLSGTRLPVPPQELLPGPDTLPPELFERYVELMQRCWDANPANRPTFAAIAAQLRDILEGLERAPCC